MPFEQAASATRRRGVLGDKNRMIFHRGLFAVIFGKRRSNAGGNQIEGMPADGLESLFLQIG